MARFIRAERTIIIPCRDTVRCRPCDSTVEVIISGHIRERGRDPLVRLSCKSPQEGYNGGAVAIVSRTEGIIIVTRCDSEIGCPVDWVVEEIIGIGDVGEKYFGFNGKYFSSLLSLIS